MNFDAPAAASGVVSLNSSLGTGEGGEPGDFAINNLAFLAWPGVTWGSYVHPANLLFVTGYRSDFSGNFFAGADLYGADLSYAWLTNCNFRGADCYGVDFTGANLTGSDFSNLPGTSGPYSGEADCYACDFTDAVLVNVNFTNADFDLCCFIGANLTGATLTGAYMGDVTYDATTIWPTGFDVGGITSPRSAYVNFAGQTVTPDMIANRFLGHANFAGADLTATELGSAACMRANFIGAMLSSMPSNAVHASFVDASIQTVITGVGNEGRINGNYAFADLTGAHFSTNVSILTYVVLESCNFSYARLINTTKDPLLQLLIADSMMAYVDLSGAVLTTTAGLPSGGGTSNYSFAILDGVVGGTYNSCNLSYASFKNAQLTNSTFYYSNIAAADFTGATVFLSAFVGPTFFLSRSTEASPLSANPAIRTTDTQLPPSIDASSIPLANSPAAQYHYGSTGLNDVHGQTIDSAHLPPSFWELSEATDLVISPGTTVAGIGFYVSNVTGLTFAGTILSAVDADLANFGAPDTDPDAIPAEVPFAMPTSSGTPRGAVRNRPCPKILPMTVTQLDPVDA